MLKKPRSTDRSATFRRLCRPLPAIPEAVGQLNVRELAILRLIATGTDNGHIAAP